MNVDVNLEAERCPVLLVCSRAVKVGALEQWSGWGTEKTWHCSVTS